MEKTERKFTILSSQVYKIISSGVFRRDAIHSQFRICVCTFRNHLKWRSYSNKMCGKFLFYICLRPFTIYSDRIFFLHFPFHSVYTTKWILDECSCIIMKAYRKKDVFLWHLSLNSSGMLMGFLQKMLS